jgi:hypothetical protein
MLRLALITSVGAADLGADGELLLPALGRLGIAGIPVGWGVNLETGAFDGAVIRSASDYIDDPRRFLDWCGETSSRMPLANPVDVLAWNSDKRYLRDLERAGVAIIPTLWVGPGESLAGIPWERFVVKPAVSAGARSSATYDRSGLAEACRHVDAITAGGVTAMVQPHLRSIDREGEVGVYAIGGELSHAIRKAGVLRGGAPPALDLSLGRHQEVVPSPLLEEHVQFARAVLDGVPGGPDRLLYARVDMAHGERGELLLLELECIEPRLFLEHAPARAGAVAGAFAAWLEGSPRRGRRGAQPRAACRSGHNGCP